MNTNKTMKRYFAFLAFAVWILILFGAPVSAADSYTYSIMHISDTEKLAENYPSTLNYTFSYLESIKHTYNISAIIVTGDLVGDGNNVSQWINYVHARSLTTIPVYEIPGNHELESDEDNHFYDEFVRNKTDLNAVINDFTFIGIGYTKEPLSDSEIHRYTSIIRKNPQNFTLIAVHNYFNHDLTVSPLGKSIKTNLVLKPTFVLSGHAHATILRSRLVKGIPYVEDLTDYQDNGDFSAGKLYTIHVTEGDVSSITVRDAYIFPAQYFDQEKIVYNMTENPNSPFRTTTPGDQTDPDGDMLYEDLNGNGRKDFNDVFVFFRQESWISSNEPIRMFDFNSQGRFDFIDIARIFKEA